MIVDAHVHFWDPGELEYPWLEPMPELRRAFLPADFTRAADGASVSRLIAVEANCAPSQGAREVEFFERLSKTDPRVAGIVAYVDLNDTAARDRALDGLASHSLVKGVRHNIQGQPPGFCVQRPFVDGVREVGRRGYTFDLCITADQFADAIALVERCPETRFALDHCGKPQIRDGDVAWPDLIERLSRFAHVSCKISGLLTEASPDSALDDSLRYAMHAAECFGAKRVMFGSDWPVLTVAGAYAEWLSLARALTASWPASDARRFFGDNASEFYRL
jgi:L-fuconolactonase